MDLPEGADRRDGEGLGRRIWRSGGRRLEEQGLTGRERGGARRPGEGPTGGEAAGGRRWPWGGRRREEEAVGGGRRREEEAVGGWIRESEESFQEKRTSLSGVYLKVNLPIERHASKIYTRAMFEQFGESLYMARAYEIDVVEPMKLYHLTHVDALAREKWSKVQFKVEVSDDKSTFACECGHFEHSGMVCCHAFKVMIELKLATIPVKYIMKRWTKDARDILPEHLARYQKDKGPRGYETYRHNAMYIKALECVRLGDSNVKCYDVFMAMMNEVYTTLLPLSQGKDGMGLEEREAAQGRPGTDGTYASIADGTNFMEQCETMSNCSGIVPASSKRPAGRPTTSREKAPYEHKQKRSLFARYVVVRDTRAQPVPIEAICQNHQGKCPGAQSVADGAVEFVGSGGVTQAESSMASAFHEGSVLEQGPVAGSEASVVHEDLDAISDVPRSPAANIPLTTPQQPCVGAGAKSSVGRGCASQQSAGFSGEASLSTEKVLQALKDTMEFEYKRQEEELDKTMEVIKKKVLEQMRAEACAKRHRDLEASLEFFMGKVKKQATAGRFYECVPPVSMRARAGTVVSQELAESSRKAASAMMAVVVQNEELGSAGSDENRVVGQGLHNEELGAGVGDVVAGTVSKTPEVPDMSLTHFWVEPCKSPAATQGGDEPTDKQMVVDNKGKGPAFHGFYESVYLLTCHNGLGRVWYENHKPTPLKLNGYKLKYQYSLTGEMFYSGLDAWIHGFNEREKNMMEEANLENATPREAHDILLALVSSNSIGYQLRLCRTIMMPVSIERGWNLYVFDMKLKRVNVLDPVLTDQSVEAYRSKHSYTIDYMLKGLKRIGAMLADGWAMEISEWTIRYNRSMHVPCGSGESPG
ncbi:hypothetical protein ZWY2020_032089 [Hordeum vulgare]|nr:hypothetical protein ZWY2020_032089 [Hordeum vulgare]